MWVLKCDQCTIVFVDRVHDEVRICENFFLSNGAKGVK